ncbi:MAG: DUF448 domain-containing protein [Henriciella sp.]
MTAEDQTSERQCVVTRERLEPRQMLRFVASPDGVITPDVAARLPGRGAWVEAKRDVLEAALGKGHLAQALSATRPEGDLLALVDQLLLKRCQEVLSIGRRSGIVLGGGGKIRAAGQAMGLIIAQDASPREARSLCGDVPHQWRAEGFTGEELGQAFGRPSIAFVAVLPKDAQHASRIRDELVRLDGYRAGSKERAITS